MATNNAINAPLPLSPTQGGSGLASPTAHGILVAEGASNFNPIVLTNGQLLIGSTGLDPVAAALTAGTNISITNGSGSISIAASGPGSFVWTAITSTSQTMVSNNGYIANAGTLLTFTLPATAAVGDLFEVGGLGAGGWKIAQNASQLIHFGNVTTTTGTGGSLASTNQYDSLRFICVVTNTTFLVLSSMGNITYV